MIVGLAVPRTVGHLLALPGDPIADAIRIDGPVDAVELDRLVESRRAALAWIGEAALWQELGSAHYLRAQALPLDEAQARLGELAAARDALTRALEARPLDSHGWMRLALVELLLLHRDAAARALETSIESAPAQRDQLDGRIRLGLLLWDRLSDAGHDLWQQQVRLRWRSDGAATGQLIKRLRNVPRFRAALASEPGGDAWMDALVASPAFRQP
ncbi:hypothetical protein [Tistlia consotensis]|uniref:hypothetical protein n=1 Tax=Tistlia consotensis TaxID=1321365 RepID=UPI000A161ED9|nr:hypothetical protein [Tistlia consotensis]